MPPVLDTPAKEQEIGFILIKHCSSADHLKGTLFRARAEQPWGKPERRALSPLVGKAGARQLGLEWILRSD